MRAMHKITILAVSLTKKHKNLVCIVLASVVVVPIALIVTCYSVVSPSKKFVTSQQNAEQTEVGIVLGSGITKTGKPYDELKARLDSAADALNKGTVAKLILSGDNRFPNYDEPTAMKQYLIENRAIPGEKLISDYAGRSTFESCERAAKIFNVRKLIIFSAGSHLPRAIYICRHFNIEAYGIASGVEANNNTRRELLARVKAVYNTHFIGERTVLGEPVPLQ